MSSGRITAGLGESPVACEDNAVLSVPCSDVETEVGGGGDTGAEATPTRQQVAEGTGMALRPPRGAY